VDEERESLWERFELWQKNSNVGMNKDRYLEMQEQLGRKPDPEKCPPGIEDFPDEVVEAIQIFNYLGDRVYPEIGYIGKDYTNLPILIKVFEIDNRELLLEVLSRLDSEAIKISQERLKREYDKIKRKK
jgi:hypothetical protein